MSWEFYIRPLQGDEPFAQNVLDECFEYWKSYPTFTRANGAISVCMNQAHRDSVVARGAQDRPHPMCITLAFEPAELTLCTYGHELDQEWLKFAAWFMAKHPAILVEEGNKRCTLEELADRLRLP